jgi:hypothetical protein
MHNKTMLETSELTEENMKRAREFLRYLLLHVGPLIDEMQLTRNEVELGFAYVLGESLSHREKDLRPILATQWHEVVIDTAEAAASARRHRGSAET